LLTALGVPAAASHFAIEELAAHQKTRDANRDLCLDMAHDPILTAARNLTSVENDCWLEWRDGIDTPASPVWIRMFVVTTLFFGLAWAIALGIRMLVLRAAISRRL
jgi:hypothetical protein